MTRKSINSRKLTQAERSTLLNEIARYPQGRRSGPIQTLLEDGVSESTLIDSGATDEEIRQARATNDENFRRRERHGLI